ncbi:hypothetical protein VPHD479_0279 [Vibrio phage D479]
MTREHLNQTCTHFEINEAGSIDYYHIGSTGLVAKFISENWGWKDMSISLRTADRLKTFISVELCEKELHENHFS